MTYQINNDSLYKLIDNIKKEFKLPYEEFKATMDSLILMLLEKNDTVFTSKTIIPNIDSSIKLDIDDDIIKRSIITIKDIRLMNYSLYSAIPDNGYSPEMLASLENARYMPCIFVKEYVRISSEINRTVRPFMSIGDPRITAVKFGIMDGLIKRNFNNYYLFEFDISNGKNSFGVTHITH